MWCWHSTTAGSGAHPVPVPWLKITMHTRAMAGVIWMTDQRGQKTIPFIALFFLSSVAIQRLRIRKPRRRCWLMKHRIEKKRKKKQNGGQWDEDERMVWHEMPTVSACVFVFFFSVLAPFFVFFLSFLTIFLVFQRFHNGLLPLLHITDKNDERQMNKISIKNIMLPERDRERSKRTALSIFFFFFTIEMRLNCFELIIFIK